MSKFNWLRGFGPVGTTIANILVFLTTNWGVVVSVAFGLLASIWATAYNFFSQPHVGMAIFMFLVAFWTYIGFVILIDRSKPTLVRSAPDYRYGLTFEGFMLLVSPDFEKDEGELRFGILLRNYSSGPIKYTIEAFDVRIGNRALPKVKKDSLFGFMARGAGRTSHTEAFKRSDFKQLIGQRLSGTADLLISYGHPEESPVRQLSISLEITMEIPDTGQIGFGHNILKEMDQPLEFFQRDTV